GHDIKGTDFISRLTGFLDVSGVNSKHEKATDRQDFSYVVRRALLLRSQLLRYAPSCFGERNELNADAGYLRKFLSVHAYEHGARSLETIIAAGRWGKSDRFGPAGLPPEQVLRLHIDAESAKALHEK